MSDFEKQKYTAIKLKGYQYFIWFETEKVTIDLGCFIGEAGWGKGGAYTNVKCKVDEIQSFIYSKEIHYN